MTSHSSRISTSPGCSSAFASATVKPHFSSTRIEATDFAFFVTAVMINRQTGGDLSEVLKNISHTIRQRMRLQQQVKAKTA